MSGSTIGGVVGGVIGYAIGGPAGAQWGFMIGSAVGGYVDPVQVKGPRLSDSMSQTSTVGGVIPFGYGRYVTAGNIIWCDRLIEHVKRQRQGKGASSKTTTYTYTRSYAVGVCQGEIYGFHWIKRNGKKVYTSDPAATAEEKAYSAKWLQKVSLYLGSESQMPDSTIVAVEGAGNVSPFRGLAYIVVENDDLTDLSGAIPQYEFCVTASAPDVYVTSHPFPISSRDALTLRPAPVTAELRTILHQSYEFEGMSVSSVPLSGECRDAYVKAWYFPNPITVQIAPMGGTLRSAQATVTADGWNTVRVSATPLSGSLAVKLITSLADDDNIIRVSKLPVGGTLS